MRPPHDSSDDGDHAELAARLHAALTAPALDPAVRARHLQAIRDHAAALPTPTPAPSALPTPTPAPATAPRAAPRPHHRRRRLATTMSAAGLVVVMAASGAVAASHPALPGDALYPVKAATERLVLAAPLPRAYTVERHIALADRRLDEAAALVDHNADSALVTAAIAAHSRLLARAEDLARPDPDLADLVDDATVVARARLAALLDHGLPAVAADQARAALSAAEARLDRRPATPAPSAPGNRPDSSPPHPATPQPRPRPAPAPPPAATPRDPGPPGTPGTPGAPAPTPTDPGPPGTPGAPGQPPRPTTPPQPPQGPEPAPEQAGQADQAGPGTTPAPPAQPPAQPADPPHGAQAASPNPR